MRNGARGGPDDPDAHPVRHWRTYGNYPLPSGIEARDEPFAAFPSWFLRIECDRCGKVQMVNQVHSAQAYMAIRTILDRMRHEGCGGRAARAELLRGGRRNCARRHAGLRGSFPSMQ